MGTALLPAKQDFTDQNQEKCKLKDNSSLSDCSFRKSPGTTKAGG
jgi:hypothetical protein